MCSPSIASEMLIDGITPDQICAPDSPEELARVLKKFSDEKCAIVPRGGGTMMQLGAPLARADVELSLEKFTRILDYQPENLTVRVQAGAIWDTLSAELAKHGQMVALDPPCPAQATVGGILASNASGALRVRYGSARDLVIGMQIALTDGQLLKGGGQVVKNVAGYDLPKLFIGSLGTLGVITEATFKVVPLPKNTGTLVASFENFASASEIALRVLQSKLLPLGVEVLSRAASAELRLGNGYALVVRFGGNPRELARQLGDVQKWSGENSSITNDDAALWARLRDFIFDPSVIAPVSGRTRPEDGSPNNDVVLKISVLPTRVAEISARVEQLAEKYRAECWVQAHAFGIVYAALSSDSARIAQITEELRTNAQVTIQRAPRTLREKVDPWGPTGNDFILMQKLKREFDPNNALNPGRFVGGI